MSFGRGSLSQKSFGFLVTCSLVSLLIAGCGFTRAQHEGITSFGQAANVLGETSETQFRNSRSNIMQMKKLALAIERKKLPATRPDGTPADRKFYQEEIDIDSGLDPESMDKRIRAVKFLTAYGNLLGAFTEQVSESEFNIARQRFMTATRDFPSSPLQADKINSLGRLITWPNSLCMETEKKESLMKIIPMVSPMIQQLSDSLEKDFNMAGTGVASRLDSAQDRLASNAIEALKTDVASMSDFLVLIDGFVLANETKAGLDNISAKVLQVVTALREADRKMVQLVAKVQRVSEEERSFPAGDISVRYLKETMEQVATDEIKSFVASTSELQQAAALMTK